VCGNASDVDEGLSLLYKTKPRIALVDFGLPDGSGIEALQAGAKGYKRHEIGKKLGISTGTVGTHINKVYQKLNVGSNTEAITHAARMGLL
jgi:DNA-binding NarL/FixJ family response regulator